jgi:hypothetical protein
VIYNPAAVGHACSAALLKECCRNFEKGGIQLALVLALNGGVVMP